VNIQGIDTSGAFWIITILSPEAVGTALTAVFIIAVLVGVWIAGFQMKRTARRILGKGIQGKDLASISTWMRVDEEAEKHHLVRPYTATAADQPASPAVKMDPRRPARIVSAISLIFLSLYLRHLISPNSVWNSYNGHKLTDFPGLLGVVFLYYEWKLRKRLNR